MMRVVKTDAVDFEQSIIATIQRRQSWRSYEDRPIPRATMDSLERILAGPHVGPFGGRVRCALVSATYIGGQGTIKLGTYGVIKNAPFFLVGAVEANTRAMEDFGYVFESIILKATELGLQTCWLGGTFQRERFSETLVIAVNEVVPAVSPVGYARARRSLVDATFRAVAGSKQRKPWDELFFDGDFSKSLSQNQAGAWKDVLEMVRLAPSASNNQPWRVVYDRDRSRYHLYLSRNAGYRRLFAVDLQKIDMGIAMCHFSLAARELKIDGKWLDCQPNLGPLPKRTKYIASFIPES